MPPTIRPGIAADVAGIVVLVSQWKADEGRTTIDESAIQRAVQACVEAAACDVLIGDDDGRIVGYLLLHWVPFPMLEGTEGYISDLVVERTARGSGVGSQLLDAAEDRARARHCKRLTRDDVID